MGRIVVLLVASLLSLSPSAYAQESQSPHEAAIRRVVQHYLNGWKNNDAISMAAVLHPKGKWFLRSDRNDLREIEQRSVVANIKDNARRGIPKLGGEMRIVSVDVTEDVAVVKVVMEHASAEDPKLLEQLLVKGTRITEYLSLMRIGDSWRIVSKVDNVERLKIPLNQSASR